MKRSLRSPSGGVGWKGTCNSRTTFENSRPSGPATQTCWPSWLRPRASLTQQFVIGIQRSPAGGGMPEVKTQSPAAHVDPLNTRVHQADGEFRVLTAPADECFVISIDLQKVLAPDAQITSADTAQIGAD